MMFLYWLCLAIWVFQLVVAFWNIYNKQPVNSYAYICSLIICIMYYIERIMIH